jgi:hypothetical protein
MYAESCDRITSRWHCRQLFQGQCWLPMRFAQKNEFGYLDYIRAAHSATLRVAMML